MKKYLYSERKIGFFLAFGALIATFLFFIFLIILESAGSYFSSFDTYISHLFISWRSAGLTQLAVLVTGLASRQTVIIGAVVFGLMFLKFKRAEYAVSILASVVVGEILSVSFKYGVGRARPDAILHLVKADGFSFPSGHAMAAVYFYGLLGYFLFKRLQNRTPKTLSVILTVCLVFAIGLSRVYLGVHWMTDVLGGFTLALSWLTIMITALEIYKRVNAK